MLAIDGNTFRARLQGLRKTQQKPYIARGVINNIFLLKIYPVESALSTD